MGAIAAGLLLLIVNIVMIFPPLLGPPANLRVASDVSPPWYFSAPFMWITLLPGLGAWSLLGFAGLFVVYPFWTGCWPNADGRWRSSMPCGDRGLRVAGLMYLDTPM